ncbi:MAG: type VI secretion system tip protein VgrG [Deltaproteobacteria bacterium]|jgi:type VI secretion system secreted protein VgrG|nr:type VI secretion system tip protein VgrG [Deltaproteobacteria bacterium]
MDRPSIFFDFRFGQGPPANLTPQVVRFEGAGALNRLFDFKITLLIKNDDLSDFDPNMSLGGPATFTIVDDKREAEATGGQGPKSYRVDWHGTVASVDLAGAVKDYSLLEVGLTSILRPLSALHQNRIHLDLKTIDIIKESLKLGSVPEKNYDFSGVSLDKYPEREFVFEYDEDLWSFISRCFEREGLGLFHDQTGDTEVLKISDTPELYPTIIDEAGEELALRFVPVSGLLTPDSKSSVFDFRAHKKVPPASIRLKDYNWLKPSVPLEVTMEVAPYGFGEVYLYGENFSDEDEGRRLANIRREELLAKNETYSGRVLIPGLIAGHVFKLTDHPFDRYNTGYLVTSFVTSGSQAAWLAAGLGLELGGEQIYYSHQFECQRADAPFRPERLTAQRKISGSLSAWIDGAGSGEEAEMDGHGRYKVLFPLDISGRENGKASAWMRLAQPTVGSGYGQHYPLHPGVEVLLTFIDGNPDRPLITGAVPNGETGNIISGGQHTASGLIARSGGGLLFDNAFDSQTFSLYSGNLMSGLFFNSNRPLAQETSATSEPAAEESKEPEEKEVVKEAKNNATTAIFNADNAEFNSTYSKHMTLLTGESISGKSYEIKTGPKYFMDKIQYLQMFKGAAAKFSDTIKAAYETIDDPSTDKRIYKAKDDEGTGKPGDMVIKVLDGATTLSDDFLKLFKLMKKYKDYKANPPTVLEDSFLFSLKIDGDGQTSSKWQPKEYEMSDYLLLLQILNSETGLFSSLFTAAKTAREEHDNRKNAPKDGKIDTKSGQASKSITSYCKLSNQLIGIVQSTICFLVTMKVIERQYKSQGFQIKNTDSYFNTQSKTNTCIAARGPILLESVIGSRLADILTSKVFREEVKDRADYLKPEYGETTKEGEQFESEKAILMRTILQRTLAEEISQQADKALVHKAGKVAQLVVGESKGSNFHTKVGIYQQLSTTASKAKKLDEEQQKLNKELGLDIAINSPIYIAETAAVKAQPLLEFEKSFKDGILIKTREPKQPIVMETDLTDSDITIRKNQDGVSEAEARHFNFSDKDTTLQDHKDAFLKFEKDKSEFRFNPDNSIVQEKDKLTVSVAKKNKLTVTSDKAFLEHTKTMQLKTGQQMTLSMKTFQVNCQGTATVKAKIIKLC